MQLSSRKCTRQMLSTVRTLHPSLSTLETHLDTSSAQERRSDQDERLRELRSRQLCLGWCRMDVSLYGVPPHESCTVWVLEAVYAG